MHDLENIAFMPNATLRRIQPTHVAYRLTVLRIFIGCCLLLAVVSMRAQMGPQTVAEQYLYTSVNAERAAAGLPALRWSENLQAAAAAHAVQMRERNTLSHQLEGEADLPGRAGRAGARFSRVSENVAVGQSALQMHDALMHSPHHRENILDPAVDTVAISISSDRGQLWAVEDFAHEVTALSLLEQEKNVVGELSRTGMPVNSTQAARETCKQDTGYVGERPGFVMRYTTADLARLPQQLLARLKLGLYGKASVGACAPARNGFSSYSIAVMLYR